jgi:rhomboid protease GluP
MTSDPVASFGQETMAGSTSAIVPSEAPLAAGFTAIGPFGSDRGLREAALVLTSKTIAHGIARGIGGGVLLVRDGDYVRAREQLDRYEEENRDFPPQRHVERSRYRSLSFVIAMFALFVAFAWVTGPVAKPNGIWFQEGASVSTLVLSSEPFRAVTALTLHADGAHVLSNLVSGAIFGRALEKRLGPGAALFSIVAAGALGNIANAAFYDSVGELHRSIGASTAVFGAVGLLATTQLLMGSQRTANAQQKRHITEYLAPLVGGLALLGALGSSPTTDIGAHAFGLLAGFVVGIPFALVAKRSRTVSVYPQLGLGLAAVAVIGSSWAAALA